MEVAVVVEAAAEAVVAVVDLEVVVGVEGKGGRRGEWLETNSKSILGYLFVNALSASQ